MSPASTRVAGFYVQKSLGGLNPKLAHVSSLKGKTVFVSGGSRGIGLAIGIRAAREGANVVIAGHPSSI
jgi:NADPH:quinone reductase-like Zn-dependent oxidoreductase